MKKNIESTPSPTDRASAALWESLVHTAVRIIRLNSLNFTVTKKRGYSGKMDDIFTNVDELAQHVFTDGAVSAFPHIGIIAEEGHLHKKCTDKSGVYLSIDGIDGTEAFTKRLAHGIATMIAVFTKDAFVAAYVGDVNTGRVYMLKPHSKKVLLKYNEKVSITLRYGGQRLSDSSILLYRAPSHCSDFAKRTVEGAFRRHLIDYGSIGMMMSRLWTNEVAGVLIHPWVNTPWDMNPVVAISQALGYVFLRPFDDGKRWVRVHIDPLFSNKERTYELLIVHRSMLGELDAFCAKL